MISKLRGFGFVCCLMTLQLTLLLVQETALHANDDSSQKVFQVGIAAKDVTPDYPIRLNGFLARPAESTGVRQPLWVKAIAIGSDEEQPAILITTETLGIPREIVSEVAERLQRKAGIDPQRVSMTATHTHSAPMILHVAPNIFGASIPADAQAKIDQHTAEFTDALEQVALEALSARQPATLSWGISNAGFAINRRGAGGPVDHDLPVLVIHDLNGKPRGIYFSYACHCVTLGDTLINGDWAGYAQEHLQRLSPQAIALASVGCGADSNPSTRNSEDIASQQGAEIATAVERLLKIPLRPVTGPLIIQNDDLELDLAALPSREDFEKQAAAGGPGGYFATVQLAKLDRGEELNTTIPYRISTWSFGDSLAMVFLPGEVVVDYSLRLKQELDGARLWVNAYANGAPCYIPSERILREGGYEGGGAMIYYDQPAPFAAGLEEKIISSVHRQLESNFKPAIDPAKTMGSRAPAPEEAVLALKTLPGLTVDLVAAEPLLTSPVAIDFAPDGKLWVCEMYDYPSGLTGDYQPAGRVRYLEDRDQDGKFETSTVFLQGIPFPTGVTVWKNGVLICAAPDILYAEDTDGDGKADVVRKLFSGFGTENYQARVNSLEYGLDGWVYGSCGLFGGEITNSFGLPPVSLGNRDFRFKPDTGEFEPVAGRTQQGRPRDDWGNWFGCDNSNFAWHYPLDDRALQRNPYVAPPAHSVVLPDRKEARETHSIAKNLQLFELSGKNGLATAACGIGVYRDSLLGDQFAGDLFTCEPVTLVVHRLKPVPVGTTFRGIRAPEEQGIEFLASTNNWFRPVQARTGPDGGLWIVDMSRFIIEHPRWIPENDLANLDVRAGDQLGRIYRVRPAQQSLRPWIKLSDLSTAELVNSLETSNGWQRDMAMQLLVWRDDSSAVPHLVSLFKDSADPRTRLQVLCTLDQLQQLNGDVLKLGLQDQHPEVRRHAVRCSLPYLENDAEVAELLSRLAEDSHPQVRLQLASVVGDWKSPSANDVLIQLANHANNDVFINATILSSLNADNAHDFLKCLISSPASQRDQLLHPALQTALAYTTNKDFGGLVQILFTDENFIWQQNLAETVLQEIEKRGLTFTSLSDPSRSLLGSLLTQASARATDEKASVSDRVQSIRLLGASAERHDADVEILESLLSSQTPLEVQSAAVSALGRIHHPQVFPSLLSYWNRSSPQIKNEILALLLSRPDWKDQLVEALVNAEIPVSALDLTRRQQFLATLDEETRNRMESATAGVVGTDRQLIYQSYEPALQLTGNPLHGQALFVQSCSPCHQMNDIGNAIGPDLIALAGKSPQFFMQEILDPNRNVDSRYFSYAAVTVEGRVFNGLIVSENATSLTLQTQDGKQITLLRTDLEELISSGKSLMPEGFEKELGHQQMADLLAYLTQHRPAPKQFDGNNPIVIAAQEGVLPLLASHAEIYGDQICFEQPFKNVGYWHGVDDFVTWSVHLEEPTTFDVWLDWACSDDSAGNQFVLEGAEQTLQKQIQPTGGWNRYQQKMIGTIQLKAGEQTVSVKPYGSAVRNALMDLRGLYLVPEGKEPPSTLVAIAPPEKATPKTPAELAKEILNESWSFQERSELVEAALPVADQVVKEMAQGLGDDLKEEYRRIPWIWRVSIAASRQNEIAMLTRLLDVSLPQEKQTLKDWESVVIGGGIINGISLEGHWPGRRIAEILEASPELKTRWEMSLKEAAVMTDNPEVHAGTRYDAIRMIALDDWKTCREQLVRYLAKGSHPELQMGSVSGLSDCENDEVATLLIDALEYLEGTNRNLALDALLRNDQRIEKLLDAVHAGRLKRDDLQPGRIEKLHKTSDEKLKQRVQELLPLEG